MGSWHRGIVVNTEGSGGVVLLRQTIQATDQTCKYALTLVKLGLKTIIVALL